MSAMDLSRKEYESLLATNWSSLRHMARSPAHYRHALVTPREDTPALKRGRGVHSAVLEPEKFAKDYVRWDGGRRAGKEWTAFQEEHAGREILTEDEYAECMAIAAAVLGDPIAARYVSKGKAEQTVKWTREWPTLGGLAGYGMACKGRMDFVADCGALVDLKTTRDASPGGFGRAVVNFTMHAQAAFYSDGYEAMTGHRLPFMLVAVENVAPYAVVVYQVPEEILELGREHYVELLERLHRCRETNEWPGYSDTEQQLTLPAWAMPRTDEGDLSELGLNFNAGE